MPRIYPLEAIIWAACGKDEGFSPMSLLAMMRRFAKTEPGNLDKLMARELDPIEMKKEWLEISDLAETQIQHVADTLIDLPVGVAFVDEQGRPNWIGRNPFLKVHHGSLRGCWPVVRDLFEEGGSHR